MTCYFIKVFVYLFAIFILYFFANAVFEIEQSYEWEMQHIKWS